MILKKFNPKQRRLRVVVFEQPQPYPTMWVRQQQEHARILGPSNLADGSDCLLLLEHTPVITLGRSSKRQDLLVDEAFLLRQGVSVHTVNRGGEITYHGPGQLVGYVLLQLQPDERDVRRLVQHLEAWLIRTVAAFGVTAQLHPRHHGLWIDGAKLAALGIHLKEWTTLHGFALNLTVDLQPFQWIVPCGIADAPTTRLADWCEPVPSRTQVIDALLGHVPEYLQREVACLQHE